MKVLGGDKIKRKMRKEKKTNVYMRLPVLFFPSIKPKISFFQAQAMNPKRKKK